MPQLDDIEPQDDRDLAESCLKGVQKHCKRLFNKHHNILFVYIKVRVGDGEDAKDLTQETMLRAYRGLEGFSWDSSFKTWLFSIAKNQCIDYVRRKQAKKRTGNEIRIEANDGMADIIDESIKSDSHAIIEKKEAMDIVNAAIRQLPKRQREVLQLRQQGFSYDQIKDKLKIKKSSVGTNLTAALKNLKALLEKHYKDKNK